MDASSGSQEWGVVGKWQVQTWISQFEACTAEASETSVILAQHVPMGVQTACDPAIYLFGKTLGIDPAKDEDPVWDFGHTGLQLWPSTLALGDFLLCEQGCALIKGRRVLELGAGVGLLGPVSILAGASEVVLTDVDPLVLSLCRQNLALNRAAMNEGLELQRRMSNIRVCSLDWRDEDGIDVAVPAGGVDVLLAADVVYEDGMSSQLKQMLVWLTDRYPKCQILIAVKYRKDFRLDDPTSRPESCTSKHSVVARWLGAMCRRSGGVDAFNTDPQQIDKTDGRERGCRRPAFHAELLATRRGVPVGVAAHLRERLVEGRSRSCVWASGSDDETQQLLEVWSLQRDFA